jgi:hypothetical protein
MVVDDELGEHPPEMAFTKRNDTIKAFLFDRAYKPLRVRIAGGRQRRCSNHPDASCCEKALDGGAPLPIAIADQYAIPTKNPIDIVGQVAHRLEHERLVRMRRRGQKMHTT